MCFIKINNLNFSYNNELILNNLNLHINENDFISILGPSGCGKSTLLKILAKILTTYTGNIFINNKKLPNYKETCAYMPQEHLLLPWKSLLDNLTIPLLLQGIGKQTAKNTVLAYLKKLHLLDLYKSFPAELSGGQKQRGALLRTILINSKILLLDEPFSQLDNITKIQFQNFLYNLYLKNKYTVILITHDIDEAILLSKQIYIINKSGSIYNKFNISLPISRNKYTLIDKKFLDYKKEITKALLDI